MRTRKNIKKVKEVKRTYQSMVEEFMDTSGQEIHKVFSFDKISEKTKELRIDLIRSELKELKEDGIDLDNMNEIIDGIVDSLYVAYGMALTYGFECKDYQKLSDVKLPKKVASREYLYNYLNGYFNSIKKAHDENPLKIIIDLNEYIEYLFKFAKFESIAIGTNFEIVHQNNMTKFCKTEEEAIATVEKYAKEDVEVYYKERNGLFVVMRKSDNKVLKSINWIDPKLKVKA